MVKVSACLEGQDSLLKAFVLVSFCLNPEISEKLTEQCVG